MMRLFLQVFLTGAGALAIPVVAPLIFPEESVFGANQISVSGTVQLLAFCVFEVWCCARSLRGSLVGPGDTHTQRLGIVRAAFDAVKQGRYIAFDFPEQIGPMLQHPRSFRFRVTFRRSWDCSGHQ
jgi:hypothetical protein